MMTLKSKKKNNENFVPTIESFEVFAISTTLPDFQLCAKLDQLFDINLEGKEKDLTGKDGQKTLFFFSSFDETKRFGYSLIENRTEQSVLLPFFKNINFFLKISPIISELQVKEVQERLRTCEILSFTQKITPTSLGREEKKIFLNVFQTI